MPRWSLPRDFGGEACARPLLVQRDAQLAGGSLTAVFILSQHDGAVRRLGTSSDRPAARHWLAEIAAGRAFATVGISQLTTSRRLGAQALTATEHAPGEFRLQGAMPWVTAALRADVFVTGALLDDGRQILLALPANRPGVAVRPSFELAALQSSCTAEVVVSGVEVTEADLLAGPSQELSGQPGAVGTAGLETSALALGQARAALEALVGLATDRLELADPVDVLCETWQQVWKALMACARGRPGRAGAQPGPGPVQCPGPEDDSGLPYGPPGERVSSIRAGSAMGPAGPLLPGLVVPHADRPGGDPRSGGALPGVRLCWSGRSIGRGRCLAQSGRS